MNPGQAFTWQQLDELHSQTRATASEEKGGFVLKSIKVLDDYKNQIVKKSLESSYTAADIEAMDRMRDIEVEAERYNMTAANQVNIPKLKARIEADNQGIQDIMLVNKLLENLENEKKEIQSYPDSIVKTASLEEADKKERNLDEVFKSIVKDHKDSREAEASPKSTDITGSAGNEGE